MTLDEIRRNNSNLSIPHYIRAKANGVTSQAGDKPQAKVIEEWLTSSKTLRSSRNTLLETQEEAS